MAAIPITLLSAAPQAVQTGFIQVVPVQSTAVVQCVPVQSTFAQYIPVQYTLAQGSAVQCVAAQGAFVQSTLAQGTTVHHEYASIEKASSQLSKHAHSAFTQFHKSPSIFPLPIQETRTTRTHSSFNGNPASCVKGELSSSWTFSLLVDIPGDFVNPTLTSLNYFVKYGTMHDNESSTIQTDIVLSATPHPQGLPAGRVVSSSSDLGTYIVKGSKYGSRIVDEDMALSVSTIPGVKSSAGGGNWSHYLDSQRLFPHVTIVKQSSLYLNFHIDEFSATQTDRILDIQVSASWAEDLEARKAKDAADKKAQEEAIRLELERLARVEIERKAKEEAQRLAKLEVERLARLEAERLEAERLEAMRLAKVEAERLAKVEAERKAKEEAERKAKEEAERLARVEAEKKAKAEAERLAKLEAERLEAERLAKLEAERLEAERLAKLEAERLEAERLAKEEAERLARLEAERLAKEEAERLARLEAERQARLEAERLAKEEAERQARLEAERLAKEEAERLARVEADRLAKEKADRLAKEEAEKKANEAKPPSVSHAPAVADHKMQEHIMEIASKIPNAACTQGFAWKKTSWGYQCAGGGHKLTWTQLGMTH